MTKKSDRIWGSSQDAVGSFLHDLKLEDLHISSEEQHRLLKLWHHADIKDESSNPLLKRLGIKESQAAVIRRLAEADNLELGSACKAYILLIAEGQAETRELLGEVLSGALSELE